MIFIYFVVGGLRVPALNCAGCVVTPCVTFPFSFLIILCIKRGIYGIMSFTVGPLKRLNFLSEGAKKNAAAFNLIPSVTAHSVLALNSFFLSGMLLETTHRLNKNATPGLADLRCLQTQIDGLIELNPTPDPSASPHINGTWVLLYTAKLSKAEKEENTFQVGSRSLFLSSGALEWAREFLQSFPLLVRSNTSM